MSETTKSRLLAIPPQDPHDRRVPLTPEYVSKFCDQGWSVCVPIGIGESAGFSQHEYEGAGCEIVSSVEESLGSAHCVLCISAPSDDLFSKISPGTIVAGFLDPFGNPERIGRLADSRITTLALELVPRTTLAQSMDALSSQASLSGYAAVILAADRLAKALPMMSTPAGTIRPARVLVVGTGVAGLQAIATAVRLGARVTAYDVRPTAKEQVESLGAKFAKIELGETSEASGGYANALSEDQLELQRQALKKLCAESDIIITTAQVFGRKSPTIVSRDMIEGMARGTIIVDAAIATGGNVELAQIGQEIEHRGVTIIGDPYLASYVARDSSKVLSSNFYSLLSHVLDPETKQLKETDADEIADGVILTREGKICDERITGLVNSLSGGVES
jgi:NAD(P) transhydrogenase subunit alpha